jgi:hypothetical protein
VRAGVHQDKLDFTTDLTPALSSEEREEHSPRLWKYERRDWPELHRITKSVIAEVLSPGERI